jgi:hypothetical protein
MAHEEAERERDRILEAEDRKAAERRYAGLTEDEKYVLAERMGMLIENGKSESDAEISARIEIIKARKKGSAKTSPHFERIDTANIQATKWIVKKLIEAGSLTEIFGESGTGKSFLAIGLASCVATGGDFFGYKTKRPGAVLYIAGEGVGGLSRRFAAWETHTGVSLQSAPIYRYAGGAANLLGATDELMAALKSFTAEHEPPTMAVLDTWAACLGGDDSSPKDAADGMAVLYEIRAKYPETAIVIVHHSGHMEKNRGRGWSGIYAGMDCVYKVTKGQDQMVVENVKNKEDLPLPTMAFVLRPVPLYDIPDEDSEIVSSACVEQCEYAPPEAKSKKPKLGPNQALVLSLIEESPDKTIDEIRKEAELKGMARNRWKESRVGLEGRGIISEKDGKFCLNA